MRGHPGSAQDPIRARRLNRVPTATGHRRPREAPAHPPAPRPSPRFSVRRSAISASSASLRAAARRASSAWASISSRAAASAMRNASFCEITACRADSSTSISAVIKLFRLARLLRWAIREATCSSKETMIVRSPSSSSDCWAVSASSEAISCCCLATLALTSSSVDWKRTISSCNRFFVALGETERRGQFVDLPREADQFFVLPGNRFLQDKLHDHEDRQDEHQQQQKCREGVHKAGPYGVGHTVSGFSQQSQGLVPDVSLDSLSERLDQHRDIGSEVRHRVLAPDGDVFENAKEMTFDIAQPSPGFRSRG